VILFNINLYFSIIKNIKKLVVFIVDNRKGLIFKGFLIRVRFYRKFNGKEDWFLEKMIKSTNVIVEKRSVVARLLINWDK
jgi:hypothetical protein